MTDTPCYFPQFPSFPLPQARLQPHLDFLRSAEGQRSAAATTTTINVHFHQIGKCAPPAFLWCTKPSVSDTDSIVQLFRMLVPCHSDSRYMRRTEPQLVCAFGTTAVSSSGCEICVSRVQPCHNCLQQLKKKV